MKTLTLIRLIGLVYLASLLVLLIAFPSSAISFVSTAALIPAGLVGKLSGKTGNFVFAKWKSIATLRAYQPQVRQTNTPAILAQRQRFTLIQHAASVCISFINSGYRHFASNMSQYNYFIKQNIATGISGVYPALTRNYPALKFSSGTLLGLYDMVISSWTMNDILVTWANNSGQANALGTDLIDILIVCEGSELTGIVKSFGGDSRTSLEASTTVPGNFVGKTAHFFATARSLDGTLISDSQYIGSKVIGAI